MTCEWGAEAVARMAPHADAVVIVDVLSFTTCVSVAVERGGIVFPWRSRDASAAARAHELDAVLAGPRVPGGSGLSLSPGSLAAHVRPGHRLLLPSPNGSTLSLATGSTPTFAGCLRNATAVASAALAVGPRIAVIPAGERWDDEQTLRPSIEDHLGAGAVIAALRDAGCASDAFSPEARHAEAAFRALRERLAETIRGCTSGQELIVRGFPGDVELAVELDASDVAPRLIDGAYRG
ncbi:MAG: 2-phosphosulfolactate phosphatase [Planctomycetota bacterium]